MTAPRASFVEASSPSNERYDGVRMYVESGGKQHSADADATLPLPVLAGELKV